MYYFFISLAVVTVVTHYAQGLSDRTVWVLFAVTTAVVGVLAPVAGDGKGSPEVRRKWLAVPLRLDARAVGSE